MSSRGDGVANDKDDGVRETLFKYAGETFAVIALPEGELEMPESLTASEADVARRIVKDESNAEIATARGTSERTVANQVAAIFRKLGVNSRRELIVLLITNEKK